MAKVDTDLVKMVLQRTELGEETVVKIMADIAAESKVKEVGEEKELPVKKQSVVILSDPHGKLAASGFDYTGWVVQIPEDDNPASALKRLYKGAYDYNVTPKGRRMPLKTVEEACEFGSAKIFKEHKIWVKTKEPILIVATNGRIPKE